MSSTDLDEAIKRYYPKIKHAEQGRTDGSVQVATVDKLVVNPDNRTFPNEDASTTTSFVIPDDSNHESSPDEEGSPEMLSNGSVTIIDELRMQSINMA
jgi:hypothetical protein